MDSSSLIRSLFAAALVLLAPGSALLTWLPDSHEENGKRDWLSTIADITALSIAIPALLALWLFVAGVQVGAAVVMIGYALCVILALLGLWRKRDRLLTHGAWQNWLIPFLFTAAFLGGLALWRWYQARMLVFPPWVDSVHHTLIVRKISEFGGIPPDLAPYLPVPFYYHYGFHLIDALFAYWSGLPVEQAVLWFGQLLNALVAISVYRVAYTLGGGLVVGHPDNLTEQPGTKLWRMAFAVLAALLATFPLQMPAYYLTWGRFTLLTGMILLGPTFSSVIEIQKNPNRRDAWVRLLLLIGGLCLIHYLALLLAALFLIAVGIEYCTDLLFPRGKDRRQTWKTLALLAGISLAGVMLALPWVLRVYQYNQASVQVHVAADLLTQSDAAQKQAADYYQYLGFLIGPRRNVILLAAAGVAGLLTLRRRSMWPFVLWGVGVLALSLAWALNLGPFRPDHFAIVLFFPAAVFLADGLTAGAAALGKHSRAWVGWSALAVAAGFLVAWGIRDTRDILNPVTIIATPADQQALNWVKANTEPTARFYINNVLWQGTTYRGVDGGYWLIPDTGRFSLVPPALYTWGTAEWVQQINQWAAESQKIQGCTPDFWKLVREAQLTHVYVTKGKGNLQADALLECPRLRPVYQQDDITIFEILTPK